MGSDTRPGSWSQSPAQAYSGSPSGESPASVDVAQIVSELHHVLVVCDVTGILKYINPSWEQLTGYPAEVCVGRPMGVYILEEDRRRWSRLLLQKNMPVDAEFRFCHESGRIRWFRISMRFGKDNLWTGVLDDVTRRRQLESIHARLHSLEALRREATERLLAAEDAARIMGEVVASVAESIDAAGATLCVLNDGNPVVRRVYQRGLASIPPEYHEVPEAEILFWCGKFVKRGGIEVTRAVPMPEPMRLRLEDWAIHALVGVPVFVEDALWGYVVLDENFEERQWQPEETGSLLAIAESMSMAIERDRTRGKILEAKERAELAVERLKELDQLKSEFLSTVSHELRTPLASITGFTTTMMEDADMPPDIRQEFLGIIHRESTRLAHIIEDLLDFARIEQGAMKIEMVYADLITLVHDVIDLMGRRFKKKDIELVHVFAQDSICLHLDPTRIGQVVKNLLSNALKFTPSGGRVVIDVEPLAGMVRLSVTDTGIGIPQEAHDSVFERFFRVPEHTMVAAGTGLGLPICKRIVELHHGQIELQSEPGVGTTLTMLLPLDAVVNDMPVVVDRVRAEGEESHADE